MRYHSAVLAVVVLGLTVLANDEAPIDLSSLEKETLVIMCTNQQAKIAELEQEIANLKLKLGEQHGGGEGVDIDDDMTSVPEGSWVVKITSNTAADPQSARDQLKLEQTKLGDTFRGKQRIKGIDSRLSDARQRLTEKQSEKASNSELATLRMEVSKLERDRQAVLQRITRLEKEVKAAENARTISGVTADGKPVVIQATGVAAPIGASLEVGKSYRVAGRAHFGGGSGRIVLKSATPAE